MRIVINVPEGTYRQILVQRKKSPMSEVGYFEELIKNGTVLPKGHGRLIDADALKISMERREDEQGSSDRSMWESATVDAALDVLAPTILEADKEESQCGK